MRPWERFPIFERVRNEELQAYKMITIKKERCVMDRKVKRGVAIYSYSGEYGRTMNLED